QRACSCASVFIERSEEGLHLQLRLCVLGARLRAANDAGAGIDVYSPPPDEPRAQRDDEPAIPRGVEPPEGRAVPAAGRALVLRNPAQGLGPRDPADGWGRMERFDQIQDVDVVLELPLDRRLHVQHVRELSDTWLSIHVD